MTRAQVAVLWRQVRHVSPDRWIWVTPVAIVLSYPELPAVPVSVN